MRKKKICDDNIELNFDERSFQQVYDEEYEEYDQSQSFQRQLDRYQEQKKKRPRDRQFYVKGADLIEQIRKYQKSKREDAEKRGVPLEQGQRYYFLVAWCNDFENSNTIFNASKILWIFIQRLDGS